MNRNKIIYTFKFPKRKFRILLVRLIIVFVVILLVVGREWGSENKQVQEYTVKEAFADYIGPSSRVYTVTTCNDAWQGSWTGRECTDVGGGVYKFLIGDSCSCTNSTCIANLQANYPNPNGACTAGTVGLRLFGNDCALVSVCTDTNYNYPPATIGASVNCTLSNGWCIDTPVITFSASEPVAGYIINNVESNGGASCNIGSASGSCNYVHSGGDGNFSFDAWAHSSYGDTTDQVAVSYKVDTTFPTASISGPSKCSGKVGIGGDAYDSNSPSAVVYVDGSPTSVGISGGKWSLSSNFSDGAHTAYVVVTDAAGNTSTSNTIDFWMDSTAPGINLTSEWTVYEVGSLSISDAGLKDVEIIASVNGYSEVTKYAGGNYPGGLTWGTLFPSNTRGNSGDRIKVTVKAADNCGNQSSAKAVVLVPYPTPTPTITPTPLPTSTNTNTPTPFVTAVPTEVVPTSTNTPIPALAPIIFEEEEPEVIKPFYLVNIMLIMLGLIFILGDPRPPKWFQLAESIENLNQFSEDIDE